MKEPTKPSHKSFLHSDLGAFFSLVRSRRTKIFLYAFAFAFLAFTAYLAFCPTQTPPLWFNNLFASASVSTAPYRSQLSSIFSYIFSNSSTSPPHPGNATPFLPNFPAEAGIGQKGGNLVGNLTRAGDATPAGEVSGFNMTDNGTLPSKQGGSAAKNQTSTGVGFQGTDFPEKNKTGNRASLVGGVDSKSNRTTKGGKGDSKAEQAKDRDDSSKAKVVASKNQTLSGEPSIKDSASALVPSKGINLPMKNQTKVEDASKRVATPTAKNMTLAPPTPPAPPKNQSVTRLDSAKNGDNLVASKGTQAPTSSKEVKPSTQRNKTADANKTSGVRSITKNTATTPPTKTDHKGAPILSTSVLKGNASAVSRGGGTKQVDWISSMKDCDIFQGNWVKDDSYPLYPAGSCPHIDEPFDCYSNGRPDRAYEKLRWQPNGCNIPRLNATDMLERLRGKRLVFVGDSLNRNMWESLVCVLRNSVKDKKKVFEASGKHEFRTEGSYSFVFKDFNCSVEFFRSPFLVQESEVPESNGKKKETLRLDMIERSSSKYKNADVIMFNTGHWWTHEKTAKGKDYYQEGNHIYSELNVVEAFHKALNTWAKWLDSNVNPNKSLVFFRGYSASHFSGGRWNSGGQCDKETEPIKNEKYLSSYPSKMMVLESIIKGMKTPVSYLNITRMTDYRKDAHPSIYRKQNLTEEERRAPERFQDCSHWCLPGVPDSWNEVLYAQLIIKQHQML